MSWSITVKPAPAAEFVEALREQLADVPGRYPDTAAEVQDQCDAALKAAAVLIDSGALGSPIAGNITGHANPGHAPRSGWANDAISISLRQVTPAEAAMGGDD